MRKIAFFLLAVITASCGNKTASDISSTSDTTNIDTLLAENISESQTEDIKQSTHPDTILITRLSDGKVHEFYQVYGDYAYNLHTRIVGEKKDEVINFAYDRYNNGDPFYTEGLMTPIYYTVSPDQKYIYVIADIRANSNGWVQEYQIFKVDVEKNTSKFIVDCAAVEALPDGFIVAQARCTNAETAEYVAQEVWVMHDEKIDFDGNVLDVSKKEYDYETMTQKFSSGKKYVYLKGFKSCTDHSDN